MTEHAPVLIKCYYGWSGVEWPGKHVGRRLIVKPEEVKGRQQGKKEGRSEGDHDKLNEVMS